MTQKIDFPTNIPNNLIDTFYNIHAHLPLGDTTECVLLENALDRIVSDDVFGVIHQLKCLCDKPFKMSCF